MHNVVTVFRREMASYFATPVAYVFIVIFLALNGVMTFYVGNFLERNQADLAAFFSFHPWLYLFLIPALSMRLWAEERRTGTIELSMTLPLTAGQLVIGKFLAAWAFTGIALALTFPIWLTVNYLGDPDKVVLMPGAAEAVSRARAMGYAVVIYSNQSGVARGYFPAIKRRYLIGT